MAIASPRATAAYSQNAPLDWPGTPQEHRRKIAEAANQALNGKLNSTGSITYTISSATTTLTDSRIGPNSFIGFMPTTANALADMPYVTGRTNGSATLNHANNAQADRTFAYLVIG